MKRENKLSQQLYFKNTPLSVPSISESECEESKKSVNEMLINEELGSFTNQYVISKKCAEKLKNMYINSVYHDTLTIDEDDALKNVDLTISTNNYVSTQLTSYDYETLTAYIAVGIRNFINNELFNNLSSTIAHELMHYNVFIKQETNNANIEIPYWYPIIVAIMKETYNTAYHFARMLYSTYYQEVNAFVSQISEEIKNKFRFKKGKITRENFKKAFIELEPVITYNYNMRYYWNVMNLSDEKIKSDICNVIEEKSKDEIKWTPKDIRDKCKQAYKISQNALRDCYRNAMLAFYELNIEK